MRRARRRADGADDGEWYPGWLAGALARCARSTAAARATGLRGALFSGRRTGGLPLLLLQAMFCADELRADDADRTPLLLGTSSVTAHYWLRDCGGAVPAALVPKVSGTHAHELSMVLSAVLGELDDALGLVASQVSPPCRSRTSRGRS